MLLSDIENLSTEDKEKPAGTETTETKPESTKDTDISPSDETVTPEKETTSEEQEKGETETAAEDKKDQVDTSASTKIEATTTTETLSKFDSSTDMPDIQATEEVKPNEETIAESPPPEITKPEAIENDNKDIIEDTETVEGEKVIDPSKDNELTPEEKSPKLKAPQDPAQQIEIEDPDDYLLHLEVILKQIHTRFYSIYDETKEIPDLKIIVPKIRSEVLKNCYLVFSGLVPTNMKLQQSRAYFIAKSLGAEVSQNINAGK